MGRKKVEQKKEAVIQTRVTEEKKDEFLKIAFQEGKNISELVLESLEIRKKIKALADLYTAGNVEVFLFQISEFFKTAFRR